MKRRELIAKFPLIPLGAMAFGLLSSCGNGGDSSSYPTAGPQSTPTPTPTPPPSPVPTPSPAGCNANGASTIVGMSNGHTHPATLIPAGEITAGTQQSYLIPDGGAGHTHNFTLGSSNFSTLQTNTPVTVVTDPDGSGHSHAVMVNCI